MNLKEECSLTLSISHCLSLSLIDERWSEMKGVSRVINWEKEAVPPHNFAAFRHLPTRLDWLLPEKRRGEVNNSIHGDTVVTALRYPWSHNQIGYWRYRIFLWKVTPRYDIRVSLMVHQIGSDTITTSLYKGTPRLRVSTDTVSLLLPWILSLKGTPPGYGSEPICRLESRLSVRGLLLPLA